MMRLAKHGGSLSRPSEPLLRWLRKLLQERKLTAAGLAEGAGIERQRVRHLLSGGEAMTVDELLQITKALDLSPTDFGLAADLPPGSEEEPPAPEEVPQGLLQQALDPYGNQPRQLFEVGFALGLDFLFLVKADELSGSGVPVAVLDRYAGRDLPIKLDAAYHQYNEPRYEEDGVSLTLSFDSLYQCRFPWSAIRQLIFFPAAPLTPTEDEPEEEEAAPKRPHLRLVE